MFEPVTKTSVTLRAERSLFSALSASRRHGKMARLYRRAAGLPTSKWKFPMAACAAATSPHRAIPRHRPRRRTCNRRRAVSSRAAEYGRGRKRSERAADISARRSPPSRRPRGSSPKTPLSLGFSAFVAFPFAGAFALRVELVLAVRNVSEALHPRYGAKVIPN